MYLGIRVLKSSVSRDQNTRSSWIWAQGWALTVQTLAVAPVADPPSSWCVYSIFTNMLDTICETQLSGEFESLNLGAHTSSRARALDVS